MSLSVDGKLLATVAATATAGTVLGYLLGKRFSGPAGSFKKLSRDDINFKYIRETMVKLHPCQEKLIEATQSQSRNRMLSEVTEMQFLSQLVKFIKAKKTIDIGVYTGYSALSIALVLPEDGKVVACDITDEYVNAVGRPIWREAGVENKIELRVAPAANSLNRLLDDGQHGTFDFAFIDADKTGYDQYYELVLKLLRPGGIIAVDNTLWGGKVADFSVTDADTVAIRKLNAKIANDDRVDASLLFLGDGTLIAFKK